MSIDMYNTRTMLQALERKAPATTFLLDTFFSNVEQSSTKYVDIDKFKGKRYLAPFVRPTQQGKLVEREGYTTSTFQPPYIKEKRVITPSEILENRSMGDTIYLGKSPMQRAAELLMRDLEDLRDRIIRREEWMAAQVLTAGTIAVSGEGFDAEIDFGMDATHIIAVGTITAWSAEGADPLANLKTWKRLIQQDSGLVPDVCVMGYDAWDAFIAHDSVKDILDNRRIDMGLINPQQLPDGVEYMGRVLNLDIYTYAETYYIPSTSYYYVPEKKLFLGSTKARTARHYAAIQDLENGMAAVPYFPKSWVEQDPSSRILLVQSSPLVAMHEPDAFVCAEVLA
jgi:hypothetical protein